ncbi:WD40 repeat-containing protein [Cavenderia fasciculata]|uniref:WD40 repeat-containing protein n=1 Tax=Cavenderia fasciculata TaxID=261658 RepID=F4Q5H8_CACFS|nr:WD40 repeat-containing protein [Cavenderia fasciculata]EGG17237.1 WD40 repeat-containing protein [Cavenderia fasciculata]|eukprot:XP_004355721.1 WD40 repeat-containing protein [Cavenderia fasciculata]
MISAITWIPRGSAKPIPTKYNTDIEAEKLQAEGIDEDAQDDIQDLEDNSDYEEEEEVVTEDEDDEDNEEDEQEDEEEEELEEEKEEKSKSNNPEDEFNRRYNMDDYDNDEEQEMDEEAKGMKFINKAMKGLMYYKNPDKDPYLGVGDGDEDEVEDLEDIVIRPTDSLILAAVANDEEEFSHLNVYVYEEEVDNLYIHHDIILAAMPLAIAWMDQNPELNKTNEKGNFVAVGTFESSIDIWDLDVIDNLYPTVTLGQSEVEKGKKKKKGVSTTGSHIDSILSLSWNIQQRNVLASGSADRTAKVWDISKQQCVNTFSHHKDNIISLEWNRMEKTALLIGSHDSSVSICDVRSSDPSTFFRWKTQKIESLLWNPHNGKEFFVATEDGNLTCYDATLGSNSKPVWQLKAHDGGCSTFSISTGAQLLATGGEDETVKLWDMSAKGTPKLMETRNIGEQVFSLSFFSSSPYLLAIGSENVTPRVVNTRRFKSIQTAFGVEAPQGQSNDPTLKKNKKKNFNKKKVGDEDEDAATDSDSDSDSDQ